MGDDIPGYTKRREAMEQEARKRAELEEAEPPIVLHIPLSQFEDYDSE